MKTVLIQLKKFISAAFIKIFWANADPSYEDWYRLEYRNEYATRDAEKMNYFGIR